MKRIALLGMPNTGKSTFFNRLTGASARVGNWPGITVDLLEAKIPIGPYLATVIDLPGFYDLHGFADDERVVRHFLEQAELDLVLIVVNAVQIERQLPLVLQLQALGLPAVLLLNMSDEAKKLGITIDHALLSKKMGMPVVPMSAKYGTGQPEVLAVVAKTIEISQPTSRQAVISALSADDQIERKTEALCCAAVAVPVRMPEHLSDRLDRVVLHPLFGVPLFLLAMLLLFQAVFWLGSPLQTMMAWGFEQIRGLVLEPLLSPLPEFLTGLLLDGVYAGLTTVAAFVPIIVLFFLFMAFVEDSGYLSRAAFLADGLMARLGLDGRSFVMILMGFGCNVPAVMGTRVMRSRPLRLLSMLVIPLSLCSARLQIFLFLVAAIFTPSQAPWVLFSLYLLSILTVLVSALVFRKSFVSHEPFVLELPPYRLPTLIQLWRHGWLEVLHFLRRATKIIVLGVIVVWLMTNLPLGAMGVESFAGQIGQALQPVLSPLGIDPALSIALLAGFVAKEVVVGSFAVIYGMEGSGLSAHMAAQMDWVQAMSFMIFALVYTPCISTIATIKAESRSLGFTALAVVWPLVLAWVLSFAFYQGARALGWCAP